MNRTIHFLSTSRTALILLLATLLTATAAQTAGAQELTDFLTVSSSGTASGYFAFSDHFYKVDWTGINTAKTTSVQLVYNDRDGHLIAQTNGDTKSVISLHTNASTHWNASDITGLTPGQSSDGYTTFTDLSVNAGTNGAKVCTVTCMAANTPTWNWSADYSTCTATFTCTASTSLTTTVNATVTRSGSTATASATFNGTNYTDTKIIVTNYDITYVLNGGTNAAGNPTTYADNVGVASFANPTRTGYTFAGWYDNASFTGSPVTNIPAGSSGDKTLYAKWDIGLTYNTTGGYYEISNAQDLVVLSNYVNDGNNASGKTFKQTQDIDMSSIGNFEPIGSQPNNYNPTPFNGIYDGQGHAIIGLAVNTSSPYVGLFGYMQGGSVRNLTMVNPNVTSNDNSNGSKYAGGIVGDIQNSTIENCKVINPTLKTNSGNGNNNKGAICGGITGGYCVVTDCYFYTTTNYDAVGWNGLNVSVTASRTYTLTLNDGITTSTVPTFSHGGTGYYVSGTTITLGGLSDRTGYTSDYAASGSVTVTNNQFAMPDGDVTVIAVYTPITYTITYHAGEGVDFSTEKNAYTVESATITLDQPSPKTGYTFSGWYANAGLTGDAITAIATGSTGNMELWAKWTANTYTVHFEPVIPVNGTMADQTFTYDQEATALTKNGFSTTTGQWLRWNTKADGSGTDYADEALVQNLTAEDGGTVTLYAQWRLTHRFHYDNSIFHCYKVDTPNEVYRAYAGETVKVEVINGTSEYTIRVVNGDGEAITLDAGTNTFVMPNEEVWITYTSVKKMAYTTISLDNFESGDVAYLYDASQPTVTPTVVVKDGETVLTEGTDYTVEITNNTGSPTQMVTATVTVTGMGGYVGTNTLEFRITPFNIANCEIKGMLEAYYDGYGVYYPLERNVQVWNGETQLKAGTDYSLDVEYAESYVVGQSYNATVKGTGDWGGTKTFQFKVVALHHTVVFDANGGTGTMDGGTVCNDGGNAGQYYLPVCGFTAPNGKKFDHWVASCEPDAEKQPGNYFTAPYIRSESDVQTITVTAYWRDKATFTVTLPEEMEVVSGTLTDGKAIEDEVITFRPRPGFTATVVQANGTALTPDGEGIYTLTVTADVTVTVGALAPIDWATVNQGTDADPYMIYNKDQLLLLAHRVNGTNGETANDYEGKFFKLGADITFDHDVDEGDDYAENYEAIGGGYHYFKGNIDGDNHTVSGIRIRKDGTGINNNYLGIFGQTSDGSIHDVHLTDARIKGYSYVGGIVGYNTSSCNVSGCTVTDSYITATTTNSNYYGTICGYNNTGFYGGHLTNNYYHGCTVNGTAVTSGVGCDGADITDNNGALPAYAITFGDGVSTTAQASAPENGFVYNGVSYYREGLALPLASEAPEGYTLSFSANGTALSGNTYTVNATDGDVTINTTLRSDGLQHEVNYMTADGTTQTAKAIALDGHETVDSYGYVRLDEGTYYVGTDIATANRIWLDGDVTLILADGKNMNLNGWGIAGDRNLTIYGQSLDAATAGTLRYDGTADGINADKYEQHSGNVSITTTGSSVFGIDAKVTLRGGTLTISANGDDARAINGTRHSILGGQLTAIATGTTATGILAYDNDGTVLTLGWTRSDDCITASSISTTDGTVAVADGKALTDGSGNIYTGTLNASVLSGFATKTTLQPCLALADAADNTAAIIAHAGQTLTVALSGRTLYKDGSWNTLCLPFDVTTESGTLSGDKVKAMTLNTEDSNLTGSTLTLNFTDAKGQTIPAGTPFIIKWDESGTDITSPVFEGVTVSNATHDATVTGVLTFTGTYAPVTIPAGGDKTKLYLGSGNTLYYPDAAMTIGTHRAYFQLADELTAGDATSLIRAFALNFGDDEATGIISVHDSGFMVNGSDAWYTIDGRRLDGKPTQRGIYINNGKKVAIK